MFLAQRGADGAWRKLTYAQALAQVRRIAQALLARELSAERPIAILSGNDIEHALLGLAAMMIGVPYAPISVPYSLMSSDFGKLKSIIEILTPGLVFVSDGKPFARAIEAAVPIGVEIVVTANPPGSRPSTLFADSSSASRPTRSMPRTPRSAPTRSQKSCSPPARPAIPRASSTPSACCAPTRRRSRAGLAFVGDEPPVIVDWLPWNHTFGSNHNFNLVLDNGGSLYIDEGKPLPGAIAATAKNLKRDRADDLFQRAERLRGAAAAPARRRRLAAKTSSAASRCCSMPARACSNTSGTSCRR